MAWLDTWIFPLGSVLLGGLGLLLLVRGLFGRRFLVRRTRGCRRCRYDMSATGGHTCPECGHTARHEGEHYAGRRRWLVAAMGFALLIGAGAGAMAPGVRRDGWLRLLPMSVQVRVFYLEANESSRKDFLARLAGWNGVSLSEREHDLKLTRMRSVAFGRAVDLLTDPEISEQRLRIARDVIGSIHDHQVDEQTLFALSKQLGLGSNEVTQLLTRWRAPIPNEVAELRRQAYYSARFWSRTHLQLAEAIAVSPADSADEQLLGDLLSVPTLPDTTSSAMDGSQSDPWLDELASHPDRVAWEVYASHVRERGWIGSTARLIKGVSMSGSVASAAIDRLASTRDPNLFDSLSVVLTTMRLRTDGDGFNPDWDAFSGRLAEDQDGPTRDALLSVWRAYGPRDSGNPSQAGEPGGTPP